MAASRLTSKSHNESMSYSHLLPGPPVRYGDRTQDKPRQQPKTPAPLLPGWVRGETGWILGSNQVTPTASSAETLSAGLRGTNDMSAIGPGRYYPPRDPPIVRPRPAADFPFSADIDRELASQEPAVRRTPPSQRRGDAPSSEKNPPFTRRVRRVAKDGSQGVTQELAESVVGDARDDMMSQLGPEHWLTGERPTDAPGRACLWCGATLQPAKHSGGGTDAKKYCSASHRAAAATQRKRQAADQN